MHIAIQLFNTQDSSTSTLVIEVVVVVIVVLVVVGESSVQCRVKDPQCNATTQCNQTQLVRNFFGRNFTKIFYTKQKVFCLLFARRSEKKQQIQDFHENILYKTESLLFAGQSEKNSKFRIFENILYETESLLFALDFPS